MSARFIRPNRVLSVGERERIKKTLDAETRRLNGVTDGIPNRFQRYIDDKVKEDPKYIKARIDKLQRVLSRGTPDSISRRERTAKERIVQEDSEWLRSHMVPRKNYNIGWRDIKEGRATQKDFDRAVQGCLQERSVEFQQRALRFKNNMRELSPDDPNASNLENIRPDN